MKKNLKQPLVSVIMPVYNAGDYLVEAIGSILSQTYNNFELIIIDDASSDNSWQIIKEFKQVYPQKITAIRLKKNLNKGGDLGANIGFKKAKGEFIARMDADDICHPARLEKQVKFLLENPSIFMVGSNAWVINKEGEIIGEKNVPLTSKDIYKNYFIFHPMIHPSVMLRKEGIKRDALYNIKHSANNDLLTFFEFLKDKKFANLKDKLLYYRVHGKNDSLTNIKEKYFNTLKVRFEAVKNMGYRPTFKAVFVNLFQLVTVGVLPEGLLFLVYMLVKGIYKWENVVETLKTRLNYAFFKKKKPALY